MANPKFYTLILLDVIVILTLEVEGRQAKYRCSNCQSKKLYKKPFATVTLAKYWQNDQIKLNLRFFDQSICEEEGNFAHPLGECHKYLRCHQENERPKMYVCRAGLTFDPFTRSCQDELDARDCKACNKPHGYKIAHEKGGAKFYMCQDGAAYEFACNNDVIFNKQTRACGNSDANVDPRNIDDRYVPGSVLMHFGKNGKYLKATGLKFNTKVQKMKSNQDYHSI